MNRRLAAASLTVVLILAACGSSTVSPTTSPGPAASGTASSSAPSASPAPIPSFAGPALPIGWNRYVAGSFALALPNGWLVLTPAERDDPAAATLVTTRFADQAQTINAALATMRAENLSLYALDISGTGGVYAANLDVLTQAGPLTAALAQAAAAAAATKVGVTAPPTASPLNLPIGAGYHFSFNLNADKNPVVEQGYLFPLGSEVAVLSFSALASQGDFYTPILARIVSSLVVSGGAASGAVASAAPSPNPVSPVSALPLDPAKYDPGTGQYPGPTLSDSCPLLPLSAIATATGLTDFAAGTKGIDTCTWSRPGGAGLTLTVARFLDQAHAARALAAAVAAANKHPWTTLAGVGNRALLDAVDGTALVVIGDWYLSLGLGASASAGSSTQALSTLAALAVKNLP